MIIKIYLPGNTKSLIRYFYCMLLLFVFVANATAQGDLLIFPKRVVFEGSKRSEIINLANIGKDTATYVISFIQIRMKDDGTFETITEADTGQNFANKYLRIFPRNVTLAPNEAQTVKLQVTKTNDLQQGEYRSHLYFRAIPKQKPLGEMVPHKDSGIAISLIPVYEISIPAIIRVGESTTKVNISDVSFKLFKDSLPEVRLTFNRYGNMSAFGDLLIDHVSNNGKVSRVGNVSGIAIYTPNAMRQFHLFLNKAEGVDYKSGKLHLVFSSQNSARPVKLAEAEVFLHKINTGSKKF